jgi:hypothetical protein
VEQRQQGRNVPRHLLCLGIGGSNDAYNAGFAPLTYEPVSTYYSFVAFGCLYRLGTQVKAEISCDQSGLYGIWC